MIEKIFSGKYLKRLDNITRWLDKDVVKRESVTKHSYDVSVFCTLVLDEIFRGIKNEKLFTEFKLHCIQCAIYHDWDEALILCDMSHETKYNEFNGDEIRDSLNDLSKELTKREFLTKSGNVVFDSMTNEDPAVKAVVKFCDWLSMLFFLVREQSLGNNTLEPQRLHCVDFINSAYIKMCMELEKKFSWSFNYTNIRLFVNDLTHQYGKR